MVAALSASELVYGRGRGSLRVAGIPSVEVIYGAADVSLDVAGASVVDVREAAREHIEHPPRTQ